MESNHGPLSYQDSVLPLNYTRTQGIMYFIENERTGGIDISPISGQRSTTELYTHVATLYLILVSFQAQEHDTICVSRTARRRPAENK